MGPPNAICDVQPDKTTKNPTFWGQTFFKVRIPPFFIKDSERGRKISNFDRGRFLKKISGAPTDIAWKFYYGKKSNARLSSWPPFFIVEKCLESLDESETETRFEKYCNVEGTDRKVYSGPCKNQVTGCPHEGVVFLSQHNGLGRKRLNTETQTCEKRFGHVFVHFKTLVLWCHRV